MRSPDYGRRGRRRRRNRFRRRPLSCYSSAVRPVNQPIPESRMKWIVPLAASLVFAGAAIAQDAPAASQPEIPGFITASLASPTRGDDVYEDGRREIAQIMAFSEVKAGDTVLDLVPGSGYWSKVFSAIVGPMGKV